jgi:hypothetical protein
MSLTFAIVVGIAMGIVFGFALEKSRVFEPGVIVGQMQLQNFIMLKVFLAAVATGAVVLAAMHGFGLVKLHPKAALYVADIVGGLLLGTGIALAGACPGTVLAQASVGYRDVWFTLAGAIVGAVAYSYMAPALSKTFLGSGGGKIVFTDLIGIPYWIGALVLAIVIIAVLGLLESRHPWSDELGRDVDGDFAGDRTAPPPGADTILTGNRRTS